jgi:putative transposase
MSRPAVGDGPVETTLQTLVTSLHPSPAQRLLLLETMSRCNRAANDVADVVYQVGRAQHAELSTMLYSDLRRRYGLPANLALHAITKVIQRFRLDPTRQPRFTDDDRLFYQLGKSVSWKRPDLVSVLTLQGRQLVPARFERYQELDQASVKRGNISLIYANPFFIMLHIVDVPDARLPLLLIG